MSYCTFTVQGGMYHVRSLYASAAGLLSVGIVVRFEGSGARCFPQLVLVVTLTVISFPTNMSIVKKRIIHSIFISCKAYCHYAMRIYLYGYVFLPYWSVLLLTSTNGAVHFNGVWWSCVVAFDAFNTCAFLSLGLHSGMRRTLAIYIYSS